MVLIWMVAAFAFAPVVQSSGDVFLRRTSTSTIINNEGPSVPPELMILPLIPHSMLVDRRRRERRRRQLKLKLRSLNAWHEVIKEQQNKSSTLEATTTVSTATVATTEEVVTAKKKPSPQDELPLDYTQDLNALYQGFGTHYVDLWVGSPTPQRQTVIVDTGSEWTAFPCNECTACGEEKEYHTDPVFNQTWSDSFQPVSCADCITPSSCDQQTSQCTIEASYLEGTSWKAYEAVDVVYSGGSHKHPISPHDMAAWQFHFGCMVESTGLFQTQLADGVLGMNLVPHSFWNQAYRAGAMDTLSFSLCFSNNVHHNKTGSTYP